MEFRQRLDHIVRHWSVETEDGPFAGVFAHGFNVCSDGGHIFGERVKDGLVTKANAAVGMLYGLDVIQLINVSTECTHETRHSLTSTL